MAQLAIKNVCDAYKRNKNTRVRIRKHAAIVYDQRTMSFKGIDRVSLLTLTGRVIVPFVLGDYQRKRFTLRKGQADLVLRDDGKWFLLVTVDVPETAPIHATDFIGVDLGIAQIATDSDGTAYSGKLVEDVRRKHNLQRKRLQQGSKEEAEAHCWQGSSLSPSREPLHQQAYRGHRQAHGPRYRPGESDSHS
jgi:putative transposase